MLVRWNKYHLPNIQAFKHHLDSSCAQMASLLASEMYHVVGSVATSQRYRLAQMGLYLTSNVIPEGLTFEGSWGVDVVSCSYFSYCSKCCLVRAYLSCSKR